MSILEMNKEIAMRAIQEVWTNGNVAVIDDLFASDYVNHQHHPTSGSGDIKGREAWKQYARDVRNIFPDLHDTIEDQIAEGDKVVTRFTSRGTHKGAFLNIQPTHKEMSWSGISIDRVENGKITESWVSWDALGMLQQMGAVKKPD